jgi:hypothetical protein
MEGHLSVFVITQFTILLLLNLSQVRTAVVRSEKLMAEAEESPGIQRKRNVLC